MYKNIYFGTVKKIFPFATMQQLRSYIHQKTCSTSKIGQYDFHLILISFADLLLVVVIQMKLYKSQKLRSKGHNLIIIFSCKMH